MNPNDSNCDRPTTSPKGEDAFVVLEHRSAYDWSLPGQYAKLLLIITTPLLLAWTIYSASANLTDILSIIAATVLLVSVLFSTGNPSIRSIILIAMTGNVLALCMNYDDAYGKTIEASQQVSIYILLTSLFIASFFETAAWLRTRPRITLIKILAWSIVVIPASIYILGVPLLESFWSIFNGDEKSLALKDPYWNLFNEILYRTAKFSTFLVFTYLGACVGSFLNVVAYCVPKGIGIGLRDSICPKCETKIRRIDNLPIFSYINLKAKCRDCSEPISLRYLIVELACAAIFGSLFLYELVTGAANVPFLGVVHDGILWIIFYPKWPIISIYFVHSFFMCAILTLSLFEWDRQPLKRTFAIFIGLLFAIVSGSYLTNQPIPLLEHLPGSSVPISPWVEQFLKLAAGATTGVIIGRLLAIWVAKTHSANFIFAYFLTGLVLGWQATLEITLFFVFLYIAVQSIPKLSSLLRGRPTLIFLIAISIHHPIWKALADTWRDL